MTVDIARLRALRSAAIRAIGSTAWLDWHKAIDAAFPALFDELESLRAEVERLKQHRGCPCQKCQDNGAYKERDAIVAWLSAQQYGMTAAAIERGEHHARKEPQP